MYGVSKNLLRNIVKRYCERLRWDYKNHSGIISKHSQVTRTHRSRTNNLYTTTSFKNIIFLEFLNIFQVQMPFIESQSLQ